MRRLREVLKRSPTAWAIELAVARSLVTEECDQPAVTVEDLDAVIVEVRDVDAAATVCGDAGGDVELAGSRSLASPGPELDPIGGTQRHDPVCVGVGDVGDVTVGGEFLNLIAAACNPNG